MSSESAALALHWSRTLYAQYSEFAACTLLVYDWILCMDREVEHFWMRKFTPATLLYLVNRYSGVLCCFFVILHLHSWWGQNVESCKFIIGVEMVTCILVLVTCAIFSAMRVYAVCNRSKLVLAFITAVVLIHPVVTTFTCTQLAIITISTPEGVECASMPLIDFELYANCDSSFQHLRTRGARASVIFADALVVIITAIQTQKLRKRLNGMQSKGARLLWVLMKDGTVYFAILMIIYIVSVAIGEIYEYTDMMISWISVLSTMIVSRFMLELREVDSGYGGNDTVPSIPLQSIVFGKNSRYAQDSSAYSASYSATQSGSTTMAGSRPSAI
ncbi:hypothetical protein C8Q80DRAFT_1350032 [Daedaleopsis nitida]|nr:hypothetical protein C8Q80DRAFT_1350032 [Daedaleopsis nitida]